MIPMTIQDTHYVFLPTKPWAGPTAYRLSGPDLDLSRGMLIEAPVEPFRFELRVVAEANTPSDFLPLDLHAVADGSLLMSPTVISALGQIGVDNLQFFPCQARHAATGIDLEYRVANIVGLVRALDISQSQCEFDEDGGIVTFDTLRLDRTKISTFDIFRLFENGRMIIVSRRFKEGLEARRITGVRFISEDAWAPGVF
jgi:hypothetical protein